MKHKCIFCGMVKELYIVTICRKQRYVCSDCVKGIAKGTKTVPFISRKGQ